MALGTAVVCLLLSDKKEQWSLARRDHNAFESRRICCRSLFPAAHTTDHVGGIEISDEMFLPLRGNGRRLDAETMFRVRMWERFQFIIEYEHRQVLLQIAPD